MIYLLRDFVGKSKERKQRNVPSQDPEKYLTQRTY